MGPTAGARSPAGAVTEYLLPATALRPTPGTTQSHIQRAPRAGRSGFGDSILGGGWEFFSSPPCPDRPRAKYEGRLQNLWTHVITPSQNIVEMR
jgi:hypothetical protein